MHTRSTARVFQRNALRAPPKPGCGRRPRALVAGGVAGLILAGALLVSGCGSSTTSTSSSPKTTVSPSVSASQATDLWSGAAVTTTPMSDADIAAFDSVNEATMAAKGAPPGMWIGVWDPKKGWHIAGYGEAVVGGAKASDADHSRIGSITKTFTATAILQQVAAGKLALTDTVGTLLPDLAAKYPDVASVTVEQLLSMHSGIPDYVNSGLLTQRFLDEPDRVWTPDEIIAAVLDKMKVDPSVAEYSTTNYLILGEILRKVTGQAPDVVVMGVAAALGLNDTALPAPAETAMPAPASAGYIMDAGVASLKEAGGTATSGTTVLDATPSWGAAGGGMYSTVADLGSWGASGLGTATLPQDLGVQRLQSRPIKPGIDYGLGIIDWGNGWIGHTGQAIGWEAVVAYNTRTGAVFVGMVNETASLAAVAGAMMQYFPDLAPPVFVGK
jgi:D-alanyl-D-alanine carboxypeptidase